ncbi:helix-turn-helix transcriptional regulator [Streptomyces sp. NPDC049887]|uniref:response regulator transcription factor n=1 Tax=Streptomyces sp. NPDC049887 TaxID=3155654 RepID=UPI00341437E4
MAYRPSPQQLAYLQLLADGLNVDEIAERLYVTRNAVRNGLQEIHRKYGVTSNAEAVAQGLKRGTIRPDRATGKRLPRSNAARDGLADVRALLRGDRQQYKGGSLALGRLCDSLLSWSEPHAVSVLWGAGRLTSRDVPQTRNRYRRRDRRKPTEDAAVWTAGIRKLG